jgi:serine/threonine protein phosphatase PrpC
MSSLMGWRANNEDTFLVTNIGDNSLFAVFDGHGGKLIHLFNTI